MTQMLWLLGCNDRSAPEAEKEAWDTQSEVTFQQEAVLRYELERQKQETAKLKIQNLDGSPPSPRR